MKKSAVFFAFGFAAICILAADNPQGRWLTPDDATAKFILDAEEQWDEAACTHNRSPETVLADDFLGTAPDGSRYDKKEEVADTQDKSKSANQCHQTNAKVRLFGENIAMVYGDAFSVRKDKNGKEGPRCLTFTDTWLKRNGKWQVVAAHDSQQPCQ